MPAKGWYRITVVGLLEGERLQLRLDFGLGFVGDHSLFAVCENGRAELYVRLFKPLCAIELVREAAASHPSGPRVSFERIGTADLWWRRTREQACLFWERLKRSKGATDVHDRPRRLWRAKGLQAFPATLPSAGNSSYELWRRLPAPQALLPEEPMDDWLVVLDCRASESTSACLKAFDAAADHAGARKCVLREGSITAVLPNDAAASGWLLLVQPDVELELGSVRAFAAKASPDKAVIYSDNDHRQESGRRFRPEFRTKFSQERLKSEDWLGGAIAFRANTLKFASGEKASEYSFARAIADALGPSVFAHVPQVLYSRWRSPQASSRRRHSRKAWRGSATIIIPTRDKARLLERCIESIIVRAGDCAPEIIIWDNMSADSAALRLLNRYKRHEGIRVVRDDLPFNFSRINNEAAGLATGEVLIFLNNDTEVVSGDWIEWLAGVAVEPEVGCVGPLLLCADGTIQHAGLVTGAGGIAAHIHAGLSPRCTGSTAPLVRRDVSAVTGACLAIEKKKFADVGGFDSIGLPVAFNDVDLCLRLEALGYRNVFVPEATLIHVGSATREHDDFTTGSERFRAEFKLMRERWGTRLDADPFFPPHMRLTANGPELRLA